MLRMTRRAFVQSAAAGLSAWPFAASAQHLTGTPPATVGQTFSPSGSAPAGSSVIRPGNRLTWLSASATVPGERSQLVPDPNGGWVNRTTGQRYREFESPGPAGAGYTVADVQATAGTSVLSWVTSLLLHVDQGNATTFIDADGSLSTTQNVGDYWVPPAQLATFTDRNDAGVRIVRMPYSLGGRTYRALRIQTDVGGGWAQNTYDLDTGVLLIGSSTGQGSPTLVRGAGNVLTPGAGSTLLGFTQIAAVRQTNLPGPGAVYPPAIRQLRALTYAGNRRVLIPGSQVPATPLQVRYDITSRTESHLQARMTAAGATGTDTRDRIFPAGVIGSLWMSPDVLGRYGANQTFDQDPLTGVQAISLGRQGNIATVALQTRLARQTFGYDLRNGLLTQAEHRTQVGPAADVMSVQLTGAQ